MPTLAKSVWTFDDVGVMGWHDNTLHAWAWQPWRPDCADENELLLDIDYIVEWVRREPPSNYFSFWMTLSTLVFPGATDLTFRTEKASGIHLEIDSIEWSPIEVPSGASGHRHWIIQGHNLDLEFNGTGFQLFMRSNPILSDLQFLTLHDRGGLSFDRKGFPV
jgi:hypothetical protein